uniref:Ig-like domain-containing protein n=1 Tax=Cyprinus carpio carpio TaxID=630221 RepID=A0A9J8BT28_CYPCA
MLNVTQTPRNLFLVTGESMNITCSHHDKTYDKIFWYQQSNGQNLEHLGFLSFKQDFVGEKGFTITGDAEKEALTVSNLTAQDSSTYYCAASHSEARTVVTNYDPAYFGNGTKLTVLDPDVTITEPTLKILNTTRCKEKVTLVCVAENFYPDHVSIKWTLGDKEITEDVATDPYATKDENTKMFNISSRLKVSKKEFTPKNTFRCTVTFNNSTHVSEKTVYITGTGEDYLKSSQTMKLAYGVFIAKSALYGLVIFVFVWRKVRMINL